MRSPPQNRQLVYTVSVASSVRPFSPLVPEGLVKLGGKVDTVTSIRQCEASLQGLTSEEVQMCLEAEASANIKVNAKAEVKHCKKDTSKMENKDTFSDLFRDSLVFLVGHSEMSDV
ncbi:Perforin-1 [Oryzias melastigma]|uniref:Perforin-1 n=1 Tax=Oryzias melastigma TaxID=30732 RepID=A0A834L034_ORYME|nr:Perforin-1 [Oryzias melastigma]